MTRIVVGLGNPGPEYENTRHNAGFFVVDRLADNLRASYWKEEAGARVAIVRLADEELVLAKPQTYMNISGKAVAKLLAAYEVAPHDTIVVHDDIDLPAGAVRVKREGGHGGHNGLRSIICEIGSDAFVRVRLGIGRPPGRQDPADFVLEPMKRAVAEELDSIVPDAAQAVMHVLENGVDAAMQEFNAG